jgi:hypothetical protein
MLLRRHRLEAVEKEAPKKEEAKVAEQQTAPATDSKVKKTKTTKK